MKKKPLGTLARCALAAAFVVASSCAEAERVGDDAAAPPAAQVAEAPPTPEADPADVASADALVAAVYDVISGPAGAERDWDRFLSLFAPGARLMPTGTGENGRKVVRILSPHDYASGAQEGNWFAEGFFEVETGNVSESYGNIAHRFSSYASYRAEDDAEPFTRGINSFQLLNDGERWWVLSIFWQDAGDAGPIPERYLSN